MKKQIRLILGITLVGLSAVAFADAQVASNPPYAIEQSVIGSGGGTSSGGTGNVYKIEGTIGEPIAGTTSSNSPFTVRGGFFAANALAPTAAGVTVSGRVTTASGKGIRNVIITMTDSSGATRTTVSTALGNFSFADVPAGETYVLSVAAKRFTFTQSAQVHSIIQDLNNVVFIGEPIGLPVQ